MTRKTANPRLIALRDQLAKAGRSYDRWFSRLKRAVTALDKLHRTLNRLGKQIQGLEQPDTRSTDRV
jgi:hypothetical protein